MGGSSSLQHSEAVDAPLSIKSHRTEDMRMLRLFGDSGRTLSRLRGVSLANCWLYLRWGKQTSIYLHLLLSVNLKIQPLNLERFEQLSPDRQTSDGCSLMNVSSFRASCLQRLHNSLWHLVRWIQVCGEPSNGLTKTPLIATNPGTIRIPFANHRNTWKYGKVSSRQQLWTLGQRDYLNSTSGDVTMTPGQWVTGKVCEQEKIPWRRNLKMRPGLDGKKKTVNFMNWPNCCRCPPPSPPSWIKPQLSDWQQATWRWE